MKISIVYAKYFHRLSVKYYCFFKAVLRVSARCPLETWCTGCFSINNWEAVLFRRATMKKKGCQWDVILARSLSRKTSWATRVLLGSFLFCPQLCFIFTVRVSFYLPFSQLEKPKTPQSVTLYEWGWAHSCWLGGTTKNQGHSSEKKMKSFCFCNKANIQWHIWEEL